MATIGLHQRYWRTDRQTDWRTDGRTTYGGNRRFAQQQAVCV